MSKRSKSKQNRGRSKYSRQKQQQQYIIYGSLALVLVVIIGLIAYNRLTAPPAVAQARLETEAILGAPDAPVQIVEYGAYGCHACRGVHESGVIQQVMERYAGSVQLIFRNGLIINGNDPNGSEAAQCALDQGEAAFWTMHWGLFDLPLNDYADSGDREFVALADELGLDGDALSVCLSERRHERTASYWRDQASNNQVRVSPTFFVNGQRLNSADDLENAILQVLDQPDTGS